MLNKATIAQFWDGLPPEEVRVLTETWREGPSRDNFHYRLFDDVSARQFIGEHFGSREARAYAQCGVPAMKADYFRYCFLFVLGGVYADADTTCIADILPLCDPSFRGLLFTRKRNVANDFMIVGNANDPLMGYAVAKATENIERRAGENVWSVTGPGIMTSLYLSGSEEAKRLFTGYRVIPVAEIKQWVGFNWSLAYKASPDHWTTAQKARSIYAPS